VAANRRHLRRDRPGFLIGVVLGVFFGVLLGRVQFLADVLGPTSRRPIRWPRVTLAPLLGHRAGTGMQSKVALGGHPGLLHRLFQRFQGVREVDRNLLANARILGANQRKLTTQVIIPSALTWITASLHTSFSFALVGAVVGEFVGAIQGIGLMIQTAGANFNAMGFSRPWSSWRWWL